ncbi:MAG: hypothetical protein JWQ21_3433 [Herminiimonas sp.]|nr:hypothetical protein [Herminiimonas sp.]
MNRQDILVGAKGECLGLFALMLPTLVKRGADKLFAMAYKTTNFDEHRLFLDAYAALTKRELDLKKQLETSLTDLLNRSIQTAYSPHRPSASQSVSTDAWSLVDSSIIEDEMRLQKVTSLFHAKSGADIRDLNLRIASLFQQNMVKERENPFRPYLFSRCISTAVGKIEVPPDITLTLVEQLAGELLDGVAGIYKALNIYFEKNEVTAKLPTVDKPLNEKIPAIPKHAFRDAAKADEPNIPEGDAGKKVDAPIKSSAGRDEITGTAPGSGTRTTEPPGSPMRKVEQLLRMVRRKAAPVSGTSGKSSNSDYPASSGSGAGGRFEAHSSGARKPGDGSRPDQPVSAGEESSARGESGSAPPISNSGLSNGWVSGKQVVGDALQRLFTGGAAGSTTDSAGLNASGGLPVFKDGAVYQLLKKTQVTTLEDVLGDDGEVRNLILEGRSDLVSRASDANEMMTIDVVGMIFEFILRDTQVPAEVRAQLGRLQFLLLKVALLDPQLLTQKAHPARKLINRIGTISLGLTPNDPFSARFTAEIKRIVEALLADESDSIVQISRLLEEFETFVARDFRFSNGNIERAVEAVEEAEKRSIHFAKSAAKLKEILSTVKTDPYLKDFIENIWLRAIEKAEHTDAELAIRYRNLVPELIWSILEKRNERERARLLSHLPQMLFDLKAGLSAVKYADKQEFLGWLIESHTRAIKAVNVRREHFSLTALRKQFQGFTNNSSATDATFDEDHAQFDRRFIHDAVENLEVRLDQIDTILEFGKDSDIEDAKQSEDGISASIRNDPADTENVLSRLRAGVPIEINVDGASRKAMLNWMSASATNMILSVEGNNFPTTISVGLFRRLLENNRARFIEAEPLFERAVTALLETADQVDEIFE